MTPRPELNNGVTMPALGLGVFQSPPERPRAPSRPRCAPATGTSTPPPPTATSARSAKRIRRSGLAAREVFLETKVWISRLRLRRDAARLREERRASSASSSRPADPAPAAAGALRPDRSRPTGRSRRCSPTARSRAIGVSNFMVDHLTPLLDRADVVPAVNQIELHPYFAQPASRPSAPSTASSPRRGRRSAASPSTATASTRSTLDGPGRSPRSPRRTARRPPRSMLRWHLQHGRSAIPKSTKPHRIAENIDVFDFELDRRRARRHRRARHRRARRPGARRHHARGLSEGRRRLPGGQPWTTARSDAPASRSRSSASAR